MDDITVSIVKREEKIYALVAFKDGGKKINRVVEGDNVKFCDLDHVESAHPGMGRLMSGLLDNVRKTHGRRGS